jgi:hypothetical protein
MIFVNRASLSVTGKTRQNTENISIMQKTILFILIIIIFYNTANSQITKGNWLVSGSACFSRLQSSSAASAQFKQTNFQISPTEVHPKFILPLGATKQYTPYKYLKMNLSLVVYI